MGFKNWLKYAFHNIFIHPLLPFIPGKYKDIVHNFINRILYGNNIKDISIENSLPDKYNKIVIVYEYNGAPKILNISNEFAYIMASDYNYVYEEIIKDLDIRNLLLIKLKEIEEANILDIVDISKFMLEILVDICYKHSYYSNTYRDNINNDEIYNDIKEAVILGATTFLNSLANKNVNLNMLEAKKRLNLEDDNSIDNGGKTSYYDIPEGAKSAIDIIEHRNMNFNQGEIFKAAFCFNIGRHAATNELREINKIIYYANRQKNLIEYNILKRQELEEK